MITTIITIPIHTPALKIAPIASQLLKVSIRIKHTESKVFNVYLFIIRKFSYQECFFAFCFDLFSSVEECILFSFSFFDRPDKWT